MTSTSSPAPRPAPSGRRCLRSPSPIAAAVALLALVVTGTWHPLAAQEADDGDARHPAAAHWDGAIQLPAAELGVVVDLAPGPSGWRGEVDIPAQGVTDRSLSGVSVSGDSVRFELSGVPGDPTFHGRVAGDTLSGDFSQGGQTFPFRLTRGGPPELEKEGPPEAMSTEEALASFDSLARAALESFRVPGAAVAIVRDGEVVHASGYGVRDRASGAPVTPTTAMPIGSSTKAFTSLLVGMLVEEGLLAWNEPVRTWLPDFRLHNDYATDEATPVDLLTHRTGLPRHDLVWYGSEFSRSEIYHRLRHLEPSAAFRTTFQYNNLMYLTAGYLAGRVTDSSWEALVRSRILEPLGMDRTTLDLQGLRDAPEAAVGYREEDGGGVDESGRPGELVAMDYRELDAMGPAGSINSTVRDMAQWVKLQLNAGAVDGTRLASAATVQKTHQPETVVEGGIFSALLKQPEMPYLMYGLGWFVQPYRGHRMIHHGGNIDGFSALVSFLPDEDLGIVVLANRNATSLPTVLALGAYDRLLGLDPVDWSGRYRKVQDRIESAQQAGRELEEINRKEGTRPSHELRDYAGLYRNPGYGDLRVELRGDSLVARYHELSVALDHWHHDVFRGRLAEPFDAEFRFQFRTNLRGDVDEVAVPLEPAVAPISFERRPPEELADREALRRYEGRYELEGMGLAVRVSLRNGTLTLDVPGQPTYELVPYRAHEFDLGDQEGYSVRFRVDEGQVRELLLIQPNGVFRASPVEEQGGPEGDAPAESGR